MGDGPRGIEVFPDHFEPSTSSVSTHRSQTSSASDLRTNSYPRPRSRLWGRVQLKSAASMLNLFSLRGLPWGADGQEKVVLSATEVASLRSEIADLEEKEAHLKAQLEHIDEVLRSARLSGYLHMRMRWATLPGEPPPIDDTEVDDWLPRFFVLQGSCIYLYLVSTDLSPQDSTLLSDVVEVGPLPNITREDEEVRYCFYILTRHGLRYECSSASKVQVDSWLEALQMHSDPGCESAARAARTLISASSKQTTRALSGGARAAAGATAVSLRGSLASLAAYGREESGNASRNWIAGLLALPAAAFMLTEQEAYAAQMERTFIAIKPDGVQRGLISEIISRFERKGFKLVAIKVVVPSKDFAQKHYHDLKERPFFNGLCDFLSSGPVVAMVWEGEGVIKYGRKLIGATDPQKSEPGTIRGDLAVVVGRNIIHGSDGPETAKDEISLWFKPEELVSYTSNAEKWIYGEN
ncbi:OLC1v1030034C1 [Oldenlandia corymbosa var. corymbosa]|uniref:Nucleoside diphosphate kinase n=1 Tax=Oldenlandia corymbosa var. corymbosa TaxID=529605 RepID=A0AAV1CF16_OLDCO|nr:OLC1v1030034C1 [Oldenlandia corymbosa var. corymbosa]